MHEGHEIKENKHQLKKLLIVKQILLVSTLGNFYKTVWRICILMLGCIGLVINASVSWRNVCYLAKVVSSVISCISS